MVFTTTNLFKGVQCPQGESCGLTICIFAHELRPQTEKPTRNAIPQYNSVPEKVDTEPPAKRRRVAYDRAEDRPPSKADLLRDELMKARSAGKTAPSASGTLRSTETLPSLKRSVSPPIKANGGKAASSAVANNRPADNRTAGSHSSTPVKSLTTKPSTLNPRLIPNDPAGHAKRSLYLKHLHGEMVRLNQMLLDRKDVQLKTALLLSDQEIIESSLDEEEKLAREQVGVYGNVIKNRIAAYKKMKTDDWIGHIKATPLFASKLAPAIEKPTGPNMTKPKIIDTGLTAAEEAAVLLQLVVKDQKPLARHGYIPSPPTPEEAAEAAKAVEASKHYESCDRCNARFQVYPNRNEEGLLTSNGKCRHHPNRKIFPQRTKADTGPQEAYWPCCNETVGGLGCTAGEHHVFKTNNSARLAAVMPFSETPENAKPAKNRRGRAVKAVAFDCEMGYTTLGMEMIRITAVSWPEGEELLDVLVRPLGIVLDLNSRFSGVWPEDMTNAVPYTGTSASSTTSLPQLDGSADDIPPPPPPDPLPIVDSPHKARELLCSFLTPCTPLIGHAIDNDLNVVRLCHPTIVDSVITYPHPRGLPMRYGLKMLSSKYLHRAIQQGGDRGHDSLEDARATGDLVRVKVGEKWKLLRATGWRFVDGSLVPPSPMRPEEERAMLESENGLAERMVERALGGVAKGRKRKKRSSGGLEDGEGVGVRGYLEREKGGFGADGEGCEHVLSVGYLEDRSGEGEKEQSG